VPCSLLALGEMEPSGPFVIDGCPGFSSTTRDLEIGDSIGEGLGCDSLATSLEMNPQSKKSRDSETGPSNAIAVASGS
jgi:hypothetical protein